eukprot:63111_1
MSTEKKENTNCDASSCKKIQRVTAALSFRELVKDEEGFDDYIVEYFEQYKTLLNDYHHIIISHIPIPNQFELIYKIITRLTKGKCDIRTCKWFKRSQQKHHLNQNKSHIKFKDLTATFYHDILDNIHCYFQHSYDIGYRIHNSMLNDINNEHKQIMYTDVNIQKIKEHITKNTTKHNNSSRHERFIDSLSDVHSTILLDDEKHPVINHFEIGNRYHKQNRNRNKYTTLKEEILNNAMHPLQNNTFKISLHKAEQYMASDVVKAMKNTSNNDIEENEPISLNHILSIILYCDHQKLHNSLCRAFKVQNNENNHKINEYWNWYTYLMESVEFFGNVLSADNGFYYCFSTTYSSDELNKCYFQNFSLKFCSPTSTTGQLNVAIASCNNQNGVMLKLEKHFTDGMGMDRLRYINCSLFSYHSNEDEKLFIGGKYPLKISNMTFINTCKSFEPLIYAMTLLDEMLGGANSKQEISTNYMHIIDKLLRPTSKNTFPSYIDHIFKSFCKQKKKFTKN